ncbi:cytochrome C biogenesis protein [Helicobacter mustelae]|nr:cytochrome C biogenesis protein [Helicobacter mustelae]STP13194.1 cytochrome C biogenesis protein [Helicobacter mustelae]
MEHLLGNIFESAPFVAAFLAGILTFISPCILPLIPAYMSYISGQSLQNVKNTHSDFLLFLQACCFVLGFGLVFVLLGASMAKIIHVLAPVWLKQIAGGIVILFGLHFLGVLRFSWLYKSKNYQLGSQKKFSKFLSPFILGVSFSLGWTPCIGPIFTSIVLLSSTQQNYGLFLMLAYVFGLGVPFLLVALLIQKSFRLLDRMKRYFRAVEICSGLLLIALGVGIIGDWLDIFGGM